MTNNFKKSAGLRRRGGRFTNGLKRSGFKRPRKAEFKNVKKKGSTNEDVVESGNFYGKPVNGATSEEDAEVVHIESTTYNDLLKRLGSQNEYVANALRKRQREEHGESETDEEADSDPDSQSDADEDDDDLESLSEADERDDGDNNESSRSHTIANGPKGIRINSSMKPGEDTEKDDEALFDTDEESGSVLNDQFLSEACISTSTFDSHVNYKLSSREVDELLKTRWNYTWKTPALTMKNCNWRGTGECCIKAMAIVI